MTRMMLTLCLGLLFLPAAAAKAACDAPQPPDDLPDGATASQEEMIEGQQAVKEFVGAGQRYVDCMDAQEEKEVQKLAEMDESQRESRLDELEAARRDRNSMVEQMQAVAAEFNAELDAYQARQSGDES